MVSTGAKPGASATSPGGRPSQFCGVGQCTRFRAYRRPRCLAELQALDVWKSIYQILAVCSIRPEVSGFDAKDCSRVPHHNIIRAALDGER